MHTLNFNEDKIVFSGNNYKIVQYGNDGFDRFIEIFSKLFIEYHAKNKNVKYSHEIEKDKYTELRKRSIALAVEYDNEIVLTLMCTKGNSDLFVVESDLGLDFSNDLKKDRLKSNVYFISKLVKDKQHFSKENNTLLLNFCKLLFHVLMSNLNADKADLAFFLGNNNGIYLLRKIGLPFTVNKDGFDVFNLPNICGVCNQEDILSVIEQFNSVSTIKKYFG